MPSGCSRQAGRLPAQGASEARPGGGRRALLHSSQIAAIYTSDIKLASRASQWEYGRRYPVKQGMRCTMQRMRTSRREIEISYARADKRDKVYDQLVAAIAPALTLEGLAPFVPELPEEEEAR